MQTFLPFSDNFEASARALDGPRLRKQGVECYQILRALLGESKGWVNHPATKMWRGYEESLLEYTEAIYAEIEQRGWNASNMENINDVCIKNGIYAHYAVIPLWFGDKRIERTHRSSLYRKDPVFYAAWAEYEHAVLDNRCCERCNYYWPTHSKNKDYLWKVGV